jgi:hypothetical protein
MDAHKLKDKSKEFVLKDGTKLSSIKDLYGYLSTMSDDVFAHHVNESKNDFAIWIEHAHGEKFIALALRQTKTRDDMRKAIFIAMFQ